MVIAMQWLTVVSVVVFTTWALYISLVEHPARLRIDPVAALAQFRESYRLAAAYQASFAALSVIAGAMAFATSGEPVWAVGGVAVGAAIPFTLIAIRPINRRLLGGDHVGGNARPLLVRWGRLHWVRSLLGVLAVAVLALRIRLD
jgi:Domain of unknown function (DUF1772)